MKRIVASLSCLALMSMAIAQPNMVVVGPTYQIGNASVDSYGFTRTYSMVDDVPSFTYSNFQGVKVKSRGVGLLMDIYKPHARIGMDLVIPLKNSPTNGFNFALAFGGYIKERIGILFGGSYYSNTKKFNNATTPISSSTSTIYSPMELTNDYKAQGDFYNNNFFAQALGANGMLNIALAETCVLSFDYGIYRSNLVTQKNDPEGNYEWDSKLSRKFEVRFSLQAEGEPFGLSIKYSTWTTIGNWSGDIEYLNSSNETATVNLNLLPERKYVLNSLMFCLMIPMGNMTSTTTTITVL